MKLEQLQNDMYSYLISPKEAFREVIKKKNNKNKLLFKVQRGAKRETDLPPVRSAALEALGAFPDGATALLHRQGPVRPDRHPQGQRHRHEGMVACLPGPRPEDPLPEPQPTTPLPLRLPAVPQAVDQGATATGQTQIADGSELIQFASALAEDFQHPPATKGGTDDSKFRELGTQHGLRPSPVLAGEEPEGHPG